jgi:hypothetical protein
MDNQTLTGIELDAVVGGTFWSAVAAGAIQGAMNGAGGGTTLPPPNFPIGPATGTGSGGKGCNTNHTGVHY